jgi:hypothetical protein
MSETIVENSIEKEEFKIKNWQLFLFVTLVSLILTLLNDKFIMTKNVYNIMLSDKMESNRIDDYYEMIKRFSIYTYLAIPLILWLKITFIALLLQTPLMLKGIEVTFKETFRVSVFANLSLILMSAIRYFILFFTPRINYTNDLLTAIPGAVTNYISKESYSPVAYSFLSNFNIYEILWILIVFYGIAKLNKISRQDSFILAFSIWLGLTIFQISLVFYFNKA